jgi:hypothetical protein
VITNVADVAPSGTVREAGTVAFLVSLLRSVTVTPPAGAAALKITVPVEFAGAVTLVGFRVRFNNPTCSSTEIVARIVFENPD